MPCGLKLRILRVCGKSVTIAERTIRFLKCKFKRSIIKIITDTYFKSMFKRPANTNIYYRKWEHIFISSFFTDFDWGDKRIERYWGHCYQLCLSPAICLSLKISLERCSSFERLHIFTVLLFVYCVPEESLLSTL